MKREVHQNKAIEKLESFDAKLGKLPLDKQISFLIENYPDNFSRMIKSRKWLLDYINSETPLLQAQKYTLITKIWWMLNGIKDWNDQRVKCRVCGNPLKEVNLKSLSISYPTHCSKECQYSDQITRSLIEKTCLNTYGVRVPAQGHEVQKKAKGVYLYDSLMFKSSWEVAFYIFNKDQNNEVEFNPKETFRYFDGKKNRTYHPDFRVNGKLYEVKGSQFIKENGEFQNPYDHTLDYIYEAKRNCAVENNVVILSLKEILPILRYISEKYGPEYISQFKTKQA